MRIKDWAEGCSFQCRFKVFVIATLTLRKIPKCVFLFFTPRFWHAQFPLEDKDLQNLTMLE